MPGSSAAAEARTARPAGKARPEAGVPHAPGPASGSDAGLPVVADPQRVSPLDAKQLSKVFFTRLRTLEEGTPQHQYVRNTLIEMNMSLVHFATRGFRSRTGSGAGAEMEDVVQAGTIGLIKAIDRFEPDRGVEFSSLALPFITGEVKRHFRDTTWAVRVPRRLQELRLDLAKARDALAATSGRAPTVRELAGHMGLAEEAVIEGLVAANGYASESLDAPLPAEERGGRAQSPYRQPVAEETARAIELFEDLHTLGPLLERLSDRDREILHLRFERELTQAEIGAELGISQMQVSRILARVLARLRTALLAP
ncbi:RNA polymerase sigma factor [Streptomyces subrutilus]|uniref:RNA polymerase sigma factor n=1 Tax=Streptomyces subrutilus TaxID=36818 RepID=A0A918QTV6_9ACTN|nr:RNA polymerase sigma factor [Streptomyces subrutilus]